MGQTPFRERVQVPRAAGRTETRRNGAGAGSGRLASPLEYHYFVDQMSTPAPDLSKLTINRDAPPPGVGRALIRNAILLVIALVIITAFVVVRQQRSTPTVQTTVVSASADGGASGPGTSVTANGYVVARTRASVSAKVPGRLAVLTVSEGSHVRAGDVIARLDNADYEAQVG